MHGVPFVMAWRTMCIVTEIILVGYMDKGVLCGKSFLRLFCLFQYFSEKTFP